MLEDVRQVQGDDYHYKFQLFDPRTGFRRGDEKPSSFYEFLICTDPDIAGSLLKRKEEWKHYKVNLYLNVEDRGLTFNTNVGYVYKVELLNKKGKVVETFGN